MKVAKAPFGWLKIAGAKTPLPNLLFCLSLFKEILKLQKGFWGSNQTLYCQVKEAALTQDYTSFRKFMM